MRTNLPWSLCFVIGPFAQAQVSQFEPWPLPAIPVPLVNGYETADFDSDGDLDLLALGSFGPVLYENAGGGRLLPTALPGPFPANLRAAEFVDVDGDGAKELFLSWSGERRLYRHQPTGWVDVSTNLPPGIPNVHGVVAMDVDSDGDQDLVCGGSFIDNGQDQLLLNDGTGVFTSSLPFTGTSFQVIACDVDGDFDLDLLFFRPGLQLWRNDGAGTFTDVTASNLPAGLASPGAVATGDVDGDGDIDLFAGASGFGDRILVNNGNGTFFVGAPMPGGIGSASNSVFADVDGDGDLDLWRGNLNYGLPTLLLNNGLGAFTNAPSRLPPEVIAFASQCAAADLDGDGDPDLLLAGLGTTPSLLWNLHRHVTNVAPPAPGAVWNLEFASQPGYGTTLRAALLGIGFGALPGAVEVPPWGSLWLDTNAPTLYLPFYFQPLDAPLPVSIAIPALPGLSGLPIFVQGLVEEPPGLPFAHFTNLVATAFQ